MRHESGDLQSASVAMLKGGGGGGSQKPLSLLEVLAMWNGGWGANSLTILIQDLKARGGGGAKSRQTFLPAGTANLCLA